MELSNLQRSVVTAVGESSVSDFKTRPDYAVTVHNALVGFVELKAPGKGADPRRFKDPHDKEQWDKLRSLPNLIYTDGNAFALWQNGELVGSVVSLIGDIESSGNKLEAPASLFGLFQNLLLWKPVPPRSAKDLAQTTARLCRLLRAEVTEQLAMGSEALTALATDWRKLLFPDATDERFADGYAPAVTFGMLMARVKNIRLATGLQQVSTELSQTSTLIGAALRLLTDNAENQETLKTSLGTLTRVLDAVNWSKISKNRSDAWLYFYEDFLEIYDNQLRKQTGSYYTPPEVVGAMVGLVDEALRTSRFGLHAGLASPSVTLADPATGTGTFLLGVLRTIAETIRGDEGEGAVKEAINASVKRLIAFEMQMGAFAVAQLRIIAEIVDLTGSPPKTPVRMFVTNTLGNPNDDEGWIPGILAPLAKSRKEANKIKRDEPITVVIGNPPYMVKAKGLGGWIEGENKKAEKMAPLADWMPPHAWGVGAHSKHLRNLYIYFWRWATWKVYDHDPANNTGIVCFITAAGFLNGLGFQKMRDYLRRTCDDIWVIDCSPEGHQPDVNTRIFQGVQQPVCIVLASRSSRSRSDTPAKVRFQALPKGHREEKFKNLAAIKLNSKAWVECPSDWRAPFLHASTGAWATYPRLEDLFPPVRYGFRSFDRQWIIPDNRLINRPNPELWRSRSNCQVYMTAFTEESPTNGPAITFTGLIPDLHHYKGSFGGRVFPLWRDQKASSYNLPPRLLPFLAEKYRIEVSAEDFMAYIAAIAAHPGFTARFQDDLSTPGLRIPLTSDRVTFAELTDLGRAVIWLHTFGERMIDPERARPAQPPRLPAARMPRVPADGPIPQEPTAMPDAIEYDTNKRRLLVGQGHVENVDPGMWNYEISGKQVLLHWFSYRKAHRERPIIGDRRPPSPRGDIQPDHWLAEYTTELINVLNVLGLLVDLEPAQAKLLEKVCSSPTISSEELAGAGALEVRANPKRGVQESVGPKLF